MTDMSSALLQGFLWSALCGIAPVVQGIGRSVCKLPSHEPYCDDILLHTLSMMTGANMMDHNISVSVWVGP